MAVDILTATEQAWRDNLGPSRAFNCWDRQWAAAQSIPAFGLIDALGDVGMYRAVWQQVDSGPRPGPVTINGRPHGLDDLTTRNVYDIWDACIHNSVRATFGKPAGPYDHRLMFAAAALANRLTARQFPVLQRRLTTLTHWDWTPHDTTLLAWARTNFDELRGHALLYGNPPLDRVTITTHDLLAVAKAWFSHHKDFTLEALPDEPTDLVTPRPSTIAGQRFTLPTSGPLTPGGRNTVATDHRGRPVAPGADPGDERNLKFQAALNDLRRLREKNEKNPQQTTKG